MNEYNDNEIAFLKKKKMYMLFGAKMVVCFGWFVCLTSSGSQTTSLGA
jgi:hypothetical protein